MSDIVSREVRSRMMSGIRAKNTKPELLIRKELHRLGFRYRIHDKSKPAQPDIVFHKYSAVILVNGCFWHGHDCHLFKWPSTRQNFWYNKITRNANNDKTNITKLLDKDWRVLVIWECSLKGKIKIPIDLLISKVSEWLLSSQKTMEVRGFAEGEPYETGFVVELFSRDSSQAA